jgi:hypothetical protein
VPVLATGVTPADEERPDGLRGARYLASEKSTTPVPGRLAGTRVTGVALAWFVNRS